MVPGCDDVAVSRVDRASSPMREITFVYPYYENPLFLARQALVWSSYPYEIRSSISVNVVDDGSPRSPAIHAIDWRSLTKRMFGHVRLFRIDVDVRWNWLAARNIGVKRATDQWILMTDMDHVVTESAARDVIYGRFDSEVIYRFSRVGTKTTPHPNSWFMTKEMFWRIGGYDESASGYYGTDGEYRRRCASTAPVVILETALEHHEGEDDASTAAYERKQPEDARGKQILRERRGLPPKVLSFPYHEVML